MKKTISNTVKIAALAMAASLTFAGCSKGKDALVIQKQGVFTSGTMRRKKAGSTRLVLETQPTLITQILSIRFRPEKQRIRLFTFTATDRAEPAGRQRLMVAKAGATFSFAKATLHF